jgi:hypothetical protein
MGIFDFFKKKNDPEEMASSNFPEESQNVSGEKNDSPTEGENANTDSFSSGSDSGGGSNEE